MNEFQVANSIALRHQLIQHSTTLNSSIERLSTGVKFNRAADGAGTYAQANILATQVRGIDAAINNVQEGIHILQIVSGAYNLLFENVQTVRDGVLRLLDDSVTAAESAAIAQEIDDARLDINSIAQSAQYNGIFLLSNTGVPATFEIQAGSNAGDTIDIAAALGDATVGIAPFGSGLPDAVLPDILFDISITVILGLPPPVQDIFLPQYVDAADNVQAEITERLATVGGLSNQLEDRLDNLMVSRANLSSSEAVLRGTDVAKETATLVRSQITQNASALVLSSFLQQTRNIALTFLNS